MKQQRGQSATEFMLVMPFLILLFFTVLQFAALCVGKRMLEYATFMGARSADVMRPRAVELGSDGAGIINRKLNDIMHGAYTQSLTNQSLQTEYGLRPIVLTGARPLTAEAPVVDAPFYRCVLGEFQEDNRLHNELSAMIGGGDVEDAPMGGPDVCQ